MITVEF